MRGVWFLWWLAGYWRLVNEACFASEVDSAGEVCLVSCLVLFRVLCLG